MIDTSFTASPEENTNLYVRQVLQDARVLKNINVQQFREIWGPADKSPDARLQDLANMHFAVPTSAQPVNLATLNEHMKSAYKLLAEAENHKVISNTEHNQDYRESYPENPTQRLLKIIPLQKQVEQAKLVENIVTRALELGIISKTQADIINITRPISNREKVAQIYADYVDVFSKREEILGVAIKLNFITATDAEALHGIKSTDPIQINKTYNSLATLGQKIKAVTEEETHLKHFNEMMKYPPSGLN